MTQRLGSPASVMDSEEQEFTVVIPAEDGEPRQSLPTASVDEPSRWGRVGAALFWIVLGWWLFAAVRLGAAWSDLAYVDGSFRAITGQAWIDLLRDATGQGRVELIAAATLSVLAPVVLLASRGRRRLGAVVLVLAAGTIVTAVWHLAP